VYPAATVRPGAAGCIGSRQRGPWSEQARCDSRKTAKRTQSQRRNPDESEVSAARTNPADRWSKGVRSDARPPAAPAHFGVAGTDSHGPMDHPNERLRRHG
jgi:hypothetical protein